MSMSDPRNSLSHRIGRLREEVADIIEQFADKLRSPVSSQKSIALGSPAPQPIATDLTLWKERTPTSFQRLLDFPRLDMEETHDEVIVRAEIPGLDKDDFTVEISGRNLMIRGKKESRTEKEERGYLYRESRFGSFSRSILLPADTEPDKVIAECKNGILSIRLPKTETSNRKTIPVHVRC